ncbi:DUF3617 domain-containing protein [Trichloromonas sp.]|uniref:DUF3617 domain-containing protein n=1 Tax=Trichloromonas sp. TaxID=3069249 RepID=UPI003D812F3F
MLKSALLGLGLLVLLAVVAEAGGVDMQEGLWEITTTTEMPGVPFQIPPMTFTQCITQQDLVPQNEEPDSECTLTDQRTDGNTVSWRIVCKGEGGSSRGEGKVTYHGDSFEGDMKMSMDQGMQMVNHMQGRRIGACK